MDDGIVQLLFVLILVFASMLDVVARGRRKRRGPTGELPPEEEAPPEVRRPREGRRAPRPPTPAPRQGTEAPTGRRDTADTMVPEDLWAILTGEAPPAGRAPRPREPEAEPWSAEEDGWTGEGVLYPRDGESAEPRWRPEVTVEELPERPAEILPEDERRRPTALPTWVFVPPAARPAKVAAAMPARSIAAGVGAPAPLAVRAAPRSPASRYADLLRTGSAAGRAESLRTAIVLREVLDRPVALRTSGGSWED